MGHYKQMDIDAQNMVRQIVGRALPKATNSAPNHTVRIDRASREEYAGQAVIVTLVTEEDEFGAFSAVSIPMDAGTLLALEAAIEGALAAFRLDSDDEMDASCF